MSLLGIWIVADLLAITLEGKKLLINILHK